MQGLARLARLGAVVGMLAACAPAPAGEPIMASAPKSGLLAVSAAGANNVRILYVRGASIVLLRTVFMPSGERVESVTWSSDECCAVIATSGTMLALDTRTWRVEPMARVAAAAHDDASAHGRR